jgi:hypothetical protein
VDPSPYLPIGVPPIDFRRDAFHCIVGAPRGGIRAFPSDAGIHGRPQLRTEGLFVAKRAGIALGRVLGTNRIVRGIAGAATHAIAAIRRAGRGPRPTFLVPVVAILASAAAALSVAGFAAREMEGHSARQRAAVEAASLSQESGRAATADAFTGYIQLLRDADEPLVSAPDTSPAERAPALQRLLEVNTNRFSGLAVLALDGRVEATAGSGIDDPAVSEAFAAVRANHGNANSDIVLTEAGRAYVDYATVLVDGEFHAWGVLVARAEAARLWQTTLAASLDGGRNIIVNQRGDFSAGVGSELVGQPWTASDFAAGAVRSRADGIDSICGLHAIAADTQIDHGWNIAACIPADRVLAGAHAGMQRFALISAAAFAVVVAVAAFALYALYARPRAVANPEPDLGPAAPEPIPEPDDDLPVALVAAPVDPRALIDAYEARNARLATRLRESVQVKLMVATARLSEAEKASKQGAEFGDGLRERAIAELDALNEHDLRAIGQELFPDLVRLGLPAALHALRKDVAEDIQVDIEAEATIDSVDETTGRASIDQGRRMAIYRAALETVRALAAAGVKQCALSLRSLLPGLELVVQAEAIDGPFSFDLNAAALTAEAYGGSLTLEGDEGRILVRALFPGEAPLPSEAQADRAYDAA